MDKKKSRSASSLPSLRHLPGDHKTSKRSLANARRLYREEAGGGVGDQVGGGLGGREGRDRGAGCSDHWLK